MLLIKTFVAPSAIEGVGVFAGEPVRKGQVIARMGESGRATGPNLHFEVLRNGQRVNPVGFIRDASK